MADIFLSYKREDRAVAAEIAAALRNAGYSVWWDDDLTPRTSWDAEIEREIKAATAVLVLWSPGAARENSFVRKEAGFALELDKLVPAWIMRCELPLRYRDIQTADLTQWNRTDPNNKQWQHVLDWIARLVGRPPKSGTAQAPVALVSDSTAGSEPIADKRSTGATSTPSITADSDSSLPKTEKVNWPLLNCAIFFHWVVSLSFTGADNNSAFFAVTASAAFPLMIALRFDLFLTGIGLLAPLFIASYFMNMCFDLAIILILSAIIYFLSLFGWAEYPMSLAFGLVALALAKTILIAGIAVAGPPDRLTSSSGQGRS